MKLTKIYVDGYKNLSQCEYSLSDMNVLIGANNTGKSNFLEIFSFLNILFRGSEDERARFFTEGVGVNGNVFRVGHKKDIDIKLELTDEVEGREYIYYYHVLINVPSMPKIMNEDHDDISIKEEVFEYKEIGKTGKRRTVFSRDHQGNVKESKVRLSEKDSIITISDKLDSIKSTLEAPIQKGIENLILISQTPVLYSSPNTIREALKDTNQVIKKGRIVALNLGYEIDNLLQDKKKEECFRLILQDLLDIEGIESIKIQDRVLATLVKYKRDAALLDQLSDGTLMIMNIIVYLMARIHPIIAIEELENSIHPKLLQKTIDLMKTSFGDTQILMTTHSPILLQCVDKKDVSVIRKKGIGQAHIIAIYNDKKYRELLENPFLEMQDIFNEVGEEDGETEETTE